MALEHRMVQPAFAITYAMRVLETVDRHARGVTADHIARELGLPADYLAPTLAMLEHEGYLLRSPDGVFVLGEAAILLGGGGRTRARTLAEKVHAALVQLRDEVGAAVYFSRYVDGEVQVVDYADAPSTPKVNEWVDFRDSAHASAVGKCLLTQLDRDERRDHVARHKVVRFTSRTITSEKMLFHALDSQPPTAPTLDLQEYAVGTVCAAVPVTVGSMLGCLAVSMPLERVHRLREAADTLNRRSAPVLLSHAM
jgi:DNA-binding IclR family transcriptional regulator